MTVLLSAAVITRNEEANLSDCLASLSFADEIVVLDSESTDRTVEVARRFTDRVFVEPWRGYAAQRNRAEELCRGSWILMVDADERVSEGLRREIAALLAGGQPPSFGYLVPRLTFHLGRWIRTGGWYPNRQLRLYRRGNGTWTGGAVHEHFSLQGSPGRLEHPLLHHTYRDIADHLARMDRYTTLWANQARLAGKEAGMLAMALHPAAKFLRMFILRGGFRQGSAGFILAALGAWYVFLKYAKLWELRHGGDPTGEPRR